MMTNHHTNLSHKKEGGFSLVELIVAIGLFGAITVMVGGAMFNLLSIHSQAESKQHLLNDFRAAIDLMSREVLSGWGYQRDCQLENNGCNELYFETRIRPDMGSRTIYYRTENHNGVSRIMKAQQDPTTGCEIEGEKEFSSDECFRPVSSEFIDITSLKFYISNYGEDFEYNYPSITIVIEGEVILPTTTSSFRTSTTANPRRSINPDVQPPTDTTEPDLEITAPVAAGNSTSTTGSTVTVEGTARDEVSGLESITWENDQGGFGDLDVDEGTTEEVNWKAEDIELETGDTDNEITITARDTQGNRSRASITVTSMAEPDPPPTPQIRALIPQCQPDENKLDSIDVHIYSGDPEENYDRYEIFRCSGSSCDPDPDKDGESIGVCPKEHTGNCLTDEEIKDGGTFRYSAHAAINTDYSEWGENGIITSELSDPDSYGYVFNFNDRDDYWRTGNKVSTPDSFTVATWARIDSKSSDSYGQWILTNRNPNSGNSSWQLLRSHSNESIRFNLYHPGSDVTSFNIMSEDNLEKGQWYHFAVVVDTDNQEMYGYLDGEHEVTTSIPTGSNNAAEYMRAGNRWGDSSPLHGAVSDTRVYNRILTKDEVHNLYEQTAVNNTNMIGYWIPAGKNNGLIENFANNNDAELRGSPQWSEAGGGDQPGKITVNDTICQPIEPRFDTSLECQQTDDNEIKPHVSFNITQGETTHYRLDKRIKNEDWKELGIYSSSDLPDHPIDDQGQTYEYRVMPCTPDDNSGYNCFEEQVSDIESETVEDYHCTPPNAEVTDFSEVQCDYNQDNQEPFEYSYRVNVGINPSGDLQPYDGFELERTVGEDWSTEWETEDTESGHQVSFDYSGDSDKEHEYQARTFQKINDVREYSEWSGNESTSITRDQCIPSVHFIEPTGMSCGPFRGRVTIGSEFTEELQDFDSIELQRAKTDIENGGSPNWDDPSWTMTVEDNDQCDGKEDCKKVTGNNYTFYDNEAEEDGSYYHYRAQGCINDICSEWVEPVYDEEEEEEHGFRITETYCDPPPPGIVSEIDCDRQTGQAASISIDSYKLPEYDEDLYENIAEYRIYRCFDEEGECNPLDEDEGELVDTQDGPTRGGSSNFSYTDTDIFDNGDPVYGYYRYRVEAIREEEDDGETYTYTQASVIRTSHLTAESCMPSVPDEVSAELECISNDPYREVEISAENSNLTGLHHYRIYECDENGDNCEALDGDLESDASCEYNEDWEEEESEFCAAYEKEEFGTFTYRVQPCIEDRCLDQDSEPSQPLEIEEFDCVPQLSHVNELELQQECVDEDEDPQINLRTTIDFGDFIDEEKTEVNIYRCDTPEEEEVCDPNMENDPHLTIEFGDFGDWIADTSELQQGKNYTYVAQACHEYTGCEGEDEDGYEFIKDNIWTDELICDPEITSFTPEKNCETPFSVQMDAGGEYHHGFKFERKEGGSIECTNDEIDGNDCEYDNNIESGESYEFRARAYRDDNGNEITSGWTEYEEVEVDCDIDAYDLRSDESFMQITVRDTGNDIVSNSIYPYIYTQENDIIGEDVNMSMEVANIPIPDLKEDDITALFDPGTINVTGDEDVDETRFRVQMPDEEYVEEGQDCVTVDMIIHSENALSVDRQINAYLEICPEGGTEE